MYRSTQPSAPASTRVGVLESGPWWVTIENPSGTPLTYVVSLGYTTAEGVDLSKITEGLVYLGLSQNVDGGWGLDAGNQSHLLASAETLRALAAYRDVFVPETALRSAVAWLTNTCRNADGGFSSVHGTSNVPETALAAMAIHAADTNVPLALTTAYLRNAQLHDGSWDHDPFATAMAARALQLLAKAPVEEIHTFDVDGFYDAGQILAAPASVLDAVASLSEIVTGLPAGMTYTTLQLGRNGYTELRADYELALTASVAPGIYTIQVQYQLRDDGGVLLSPVADSQFCVRIQVSP